MKGTSIRTTLGFMLLCASVFLLPPPAATAATDTASCPSRATLTTGLDKESPGRSRARMAFFGSRWSTRPPS